MTPGTRTLAAIRVVDGKREAFDDEVAVEIPVALVYNDVAHAVMMASPGDLEDFGLGFSLTEGIVASPAEFELIDVQRTALGVSLQALIPHPRFEALALRRRSFEGRGGCGLCGMSSLEAALRPVPVVRRTPPVSTLAVARGLALLAEHQPLNRTCAGTHAAAYVHQHGIEVREDVGRHNALDKLVGALARQPRGPGFLLMTSRASYEIVLKAASAGIALVAAISAPSDLAVRLAEAAGITLIGFARGARMTCYSHPQGLE